MTQTPWSYFRKNILSHIIAYGVKWTTAILLWTCKKEVHGLEAFVAAANEKSCILMLWHNNLLITANILSLYTPNFIYSAFISNSRDAEPLAIIVKSFAVGRVHRVPHNQRHAALHSMISRLREHKQVAVITPDGPRGPKYVLKPGVVLAAKATGANIVPFSWKASSFWELGTWDRMKIPKPFSKIVVTFGPVMTLDREQPEAESKEKLTAALNRDVDRS
jgi:hypothetical protein